MLLFALSCCFVGLTVALHRAVFQDDRANLPVSADSVPQVGHRYSHSNDWNPEDPFEKIRVDTIKILAEKNGYMLYQLQRPDSLHLSAKTKNLARRIRPL